MAVLPNSDAIYSKAGDIQWTGVLTAAANDYTGLSALNQTVATVEANTGGYNQRLRFKALGTNVATVARIFICNALSNQSVIGASGTPTGVAATAGTMGSVTVYCKTLAIGQGGDVGTISAESTGVAVTGPTGSCTWTNVTPATTFTHAGMRYYVGRATGAQAEYFWAPVSTVTVSGGPGTVMTVSAIVSAPNTKIGPALTVGTVFTTSGGMTAGDYIINQLTSAEADGSMGRTGTYTMSASRTFTGNAVTNKDLYVQLSPAHSMIASYDGQVTENNTSFYGEISLPATTASATSATPDIDYPIAVALNPGYNMLIGLGTAVAAGWQVTSIQGRYN